MKNEIALLLVDHLKDRGRNVGSKNYAEGGYLEGEPKLGVSQEESE